MSITGNGSFGPWALILPSTVRRRFNNSNITPVWCQLIFKPVPRCGKKSPCRCIPQAYAIVRKQAPIPTSLILSTFLTRCLRPLMPRFSNTPGRLSLSFSGQGWSRPHSCRVSMPSWTGYRGRMSMP